MGHEAVDRPGHPGEAGGTSPTGRSTDLSPGSRRTVATRRSPARLALAVAPRLEERGVVRSRSHDALAWSRTRNAGFGNPSEDPFHYESSSPSSGGASSAGGCAGGTFDPTEIGEGGIEPPWSGSRNQCVATTLHSVSFGGPERRPSPHWAKRQWGPPPDYGSARFARAAGPSDGALGALRLALALSRSLAALAGWRLLASLSLASASRSLRCRSLRLSAFGFASLSLASSLAFALLSLASPSAYTLGRTRTCTLLIRNQALIHSSYEGRKCREGVAPSLVGLQPAMLARASARSGRRGGREVSPCGRWFAANLMYSRRHSTMIEAGDDPTTSGVSGRRSAC